jgi:hypothetical protein
MSAHTRAISDTSRNYSCRGNCPGYGTHSFCPPLIVLAMHSEQSAAEYSLERSRYPLDPESTEESCQAAHFAGTVTPGEFCNCMFSALASPSFAKSQM